MRRLHNSYSDTRRGESESAYLQLGDESSVPLVPPAAITPSGQPTRQNESPWYQTLIQTAVPALTTVYTQNQLTKMNIARINAGQAPLTASEYAAVYQPAAQFQVGPDAATKRLMAYGAVALLALVGLRAAKVI